MTLARQRPTADSSRPGDDRRHADQLQQSLGHVVRGMRTRQLSHGRAHGQARCVLPEQLAEHTGKHRCAAIAGNQQIDTARRARALEGLGVTVLMTVAGVRLGTEHGRRLGDGQFGQHRTASM